MRHTKCTALLEYWAGLRAGGAVPEQSDISPRGLKGILPHIFILDTHQFMAPVYRLAGTAICESFGMELRGVPFLSRWDAPSRPKVIALLQQCQTTLMPASMHSSATHAGGGWSEFETVFAPLAYRGEVGMRLIGVMMASSQSPFLRGEEIVSQSLTASEIELDVPPAQMIDRGFAAPHLSSIS